MEQIYVNSQKEEEDSKEYIVTDDEISNANKCINKSELKINCELMKMLKNTNLFLINKNIFIQIDYLINNANSLKSKIKYDKQNIENIIFTSALILFQRFINDKMQFQFFNKIFAFVFSLFHLKVVSLFPLIKLIHIFVRININKIIEHHNKHIYLKSECYIIKKIIKCFKRQIPFECVSTIIEEINTNLKDKFDIWDKLAKKNFFLLLLDLHYESESQNAKIIDFLSDIYKFNLKGNVMSRYIIKKSLFNIHYLCNSMKFLNTLISKETRTKDVYINKGFVIRDNNPLSLNSISFDSKKQSEFSVIFSFKLIRKSREATSVELFNIKRVSDSKKLYSISIDNNNTFVLNTEKEKNYIPTQIKSVINKDYLVCLTHSSKTSLLTLYVNNIVFEKKVKYFSHTSSTIEINMGESNFNGLFGDLILLEKELERDIVANLYHLHENYSFITDRNVSYFLMRNLDTHMIENDIKYKLAIKYFKNENYSHYLKISTDVVNDLMDKKNFVSIENFGCLRHRVFETHLQVMSYTYSIFRFILCEGTDFLLFIIHQINNPILNLTNKDLNYIFGILLEFLSNLLSFPAFVIHIQETKFLQILFLTLLKFIQNKNSVSNSKLLFDQVVIRYLILLNNFCFMNEYQDICQIIIFNFFDINLIELTSFNENALELFTTISTSMKTCATFQNKDLLFHIISFDFIIEQDNSALHCHYSNLLSLCLVNAGTDKELTDKNYSLIEEFVDFLNTNMNNFSEKKKLFYIKFAFSFLLIEDCKKYQIELRDFYLLYVKKEFIKLNANESCDDTVYYGILFMFIKEAIRIKLIEKNEEKVLSKNIDIFAKNYQFMLYPEFPFIKAVFMSLLTNCENEKKLTFIEEEYQNGTNMFKCIMNSDFPMSHTEKNDNKIKSFIYNIKVFVRYIQFLYDNDNTYYINSIGMKIFTLFNDFIFASIKCCRNNESLFMDYFLMEQSLTSFYALNLDIYPTQTTEIIKQIIKDSISLTSHGFYISLLQQEREKEDFVRILFNTLTIQGDHHSQPKLSRNYYIHLVNILIFIYQEITDETLNSHIVKYGTELLIFVSNLSFRKITQFKGEFDIQMQTSKKTIIEMAFDIYVALFKKNNFNPKYLVVLEELIEMDSKKNTTIFLSLDTKDNKAYPELNSLLEKSQSVRYSFCIFFLAKMILLQKFIHSNLSPIQNANSSNIKDSVYEIDNIVKVHFHCTRDFLRKKNVQIHSLRLNKSYLINEMYDYIAIFFEGKNKTYNEFIKYTNHKTEVKNIEKNYLKNINLKSAFDVNILHSKNLTSSTFNFSSDKKLNLRLSSKNMKKKIRSLSLYSKQKKKIYLYSNFDNNVINSEKKRKNSFDKSMRMYIEEYLNSNKQIENHPNAKYLSSQNIFSQFKFDFSQIEYTKILVNPKNYFIWKKFTYSYKDYIYRNINFLRLKRSYDEKYKKLLHYNSDKEKDFGLLYPTKLANFTCDEYYKPFLKPHITFFKSKFFRISHPYFTKVDFSNDISNIQFIQIHPIIHEPRLRIKCELITNQGYIFGEVDINDYVIMFNDKSENDFRFKEETLIDVKLEYIYSSDINDRIIGKNKSVIIYINEIQEIVQRRFCFCWIGYEIFLKDNKTFLFNFLKHDKAKEFINDIISKSNKQKLNISIVNDSKSYFKKMDYKKRYKIGEIDNFHYLLLINKYTSRSYNDISQYPVMPWVINSIKPIKPRDFSRAICQQKNSKNDDNENPNALSDKKYLNNLASLGCHFMLHYSNSGYIMHYLLRTNPFTYDAIKFQSNQFDQASRIFFSITELLKVFEVIEDNRELIPEFFCSYSFMLNLNKNDFGIIKEKNIKIENVLCEGFKSGVDFVAELRDHLVKSGGINQWIDNIFGINQMNEKVINIYPRFSYEKLNNFNEKINHYFLKGYTKEKIYQKIRGKIGLLNLGITPCQLFKHPHPPQSSLFESDTIIYNKEKIRKKDLLLVDLVQFVKFNKIYSYFFFFKDFEIFFLFESRIIIYDIKLREMKLGPKANLDITTIVNYHPVKSTLIKISLRNIDSIYIICRFIDNTFKFYSQKYIKSFKWNCFVSSIETIVSKENENEATIVIGDYDGFITELKVTIQEISNIIIHQHKRVQVHDCMIKGISYNKRLNIIVSFSKRNIITIINAYTFGIINIIQPKNEFGNIKDVKVSSNDFLFAEYDYGVECYTLNGILISVFKTLMPIKGFDLNDENSMAMIGVDKKVEKFKNHNLTNVINNIQVNNEKIAYYAYWKEMKMGMIITEKKEVHAHYM